MEESPHKCPVCNRSFNQRSNLKTHLLTHTDHKPYECLTCGKVFRRNCDLRRHALTHTIGGDVPSDSADQTENEKQQNNEIDRNENESNATTGSLTATMSAIGDDDDDEDEDVELEVDSPVHSPITANRQSPATLSHDIDEADDDVDDDGVEKEIDLRNETTVRDDDVDYRPPAKEPRLDYQKQEPESPEQTHCHHNGNDRSHYTMRPTYDNGVMISIADYSMLRQHQSMMSSKAGDPFMPMLHVRRDLHHKEPTQLRSETATSYTESMPFRKRNAAGFLRDPSEYMSVPRQAPLNLSNHASESTSEKNATNYSADQKMDETRVSTPSISAPIAMPANVIQPPAQLQQAPPPPRRRTGFSIEDIMRR